MSPENSFELFEDFSIFSTILMWRTCGTCSNRTKVCFSKRAHANILNFKKIATDGKRDFEVVQTGVFEKPQEPDPNHCCGNGCNNCVWINYYEKLKIWEEKAGEKNATNNLKNKKRGVIEGNIEDESRNQFRESSRNYQKQSET
jgi:hypothetical protein